MRKVLALVLLFGCALVLPLLGQTRSALESDPSGWKDLLADKTMKDWSRLALGGNPIVREGNLSDPSTWKLDGDILTCDGKSIGHELLRYAPELKDFILHAEYRFPVVEGEKGYNAGVYVRTSLDGKIWHQAQATLNGGFLFMSTMVNGAPQRVNLQKQMKENRVSPAGEWTAVEIRAVGPQLTLWVNGDVVNQFDECGVPSGYIGLEAEGYKVEFRNVRLKQLL